MLHIIKRRSREQAIRECLAAFPEGIAYPDQVASALPWSYKTVHADMKRMATRGRGIHRIPGHSRTVRSRAS